jgi:drug/metabolite transporter (DMT)-like permease
MRVDRPSPLVTSTLVAALCLIWGSTWLVIREGLHDLPPLWSAGVRFVLAGAVLALVTPWFRRLEGGGAPAVWLWGALGTLNFGVSYAIVYIVETVLPSGIVSVLWAVFPMLMAWSGHRFLPGERLRRRHWLGFVLGFCGVVFLFATDLRQFGPDGVPAALLLLVSPLVSAVGTTLVKRYGGGSSSIVMNRNAMLLGALLLCAAALVFERDRAVRWTGRAMFSVAYLALFGTAVTFTLYFWLLRYARANRLSLIAFVTPCIALLLGGTLGAEPITPFTVGGATLIVVGVALVVRRGQ